ncbi:site-specific DNA-methyltransferase [Pseudomonas brassicacearum]
MTPSHQILVGDCLALLRQMPDNSVDSVVTDPPYGLSFMGKKWDYDVPAVEVWVECLRVLKPGGHLLAFAGTRTQHRMACRIEDAGFKIRDMIAWIYGSGFPKSMDVSKAIDKAAGAEHEVVGRKTGRAATPLADMRGGKYASNPSGRIDTSAITAPATDQAAQWEGWGTALKPVLEPVTVARKPLIGTVAANVVRHWRDQHRCVPCRLARWQGAGNRDARLERPSKETDRSSWAGWLKRRAECTQHARPLAREPDPRWQRRGCGAVPGRGWRQYAGEGHRADSQRLQWPGQIQRPDQARARQVSRRQRQRCPALLLRQDQSQGPKLGPSQLGHSRCRHGRDDA